MALVRVLSPVPSETAEVPSAHGPRGARLEPVALAAGVLKGRWTPFILWNLFWGSRSFYRLARAMPGIPRTVLSRELSDLVTAGLVERRRTSPETVEFAYAGSPLAQRLRLLVGALYDWGLGASREDRVGRMAARKLLGFQELGHSSATAGEPGPAALTESNPTRSGGDASGERSR